MNSLKKSCSVLLCISICFSLCSCRIFSKDFTFPYNISISDTYSSIQRKDPNVSEMEESISKGYMAASSSDNTIFNLSKDTLSDDELSMSTLYYFEDEDASLLSMHQLITRADDDSNANISQVFDYIVQEAQEFFSSSGELFSQEGSISEEKAPIEGYAWIEDNTLILVSHWYGTGGTVLISAYSNVEQGKSLGYVQNEEDFLLFAEIDILMLRMRLSSDQ
ncbi:MAG: hypothetical protein LUE22_05760 [Oscillospiraceae bacterium]|nr:hypothetical protein [Oscillospiraceae bacterium]